MNNTTKSNESIAQEEKLKGIPFDEVADLRDYFAAKAMHGYISTAAAPCIVGGLDGAEDELAKGAYKMADAMLRARGQ